MVVTSRKQLQSLLGKDGKGISADVVVGLIREKWWTASTTSVATRDFNNKQYVYLWAYGVYANVSAGR